ncbi:thioesterase family protein [Aeromicrobium sp.]|uniref:thioesterase family protein n=1 Tax=Aeromicrobium sp. TaxID=1871063 RepID=UPI0030C465AE
MTTLPTYAQVLELPETIRRTVPVEYLDENDHMNIGRYLEVAAEAVWFRYTAIGMGQAYIDERRLTTFTVEHHLRYLSELRLGDDFSVHVRPIERSAKALHSMAFVLDRTRERLAFTFEDMLVHVGMDTRRTQDFPDDIATALDGTIAAAAGLDWHAPVCGVMGIRRRERV